MLRLIACVGLLSSTVAFAQPVTPTPVESSATPPAPVVEATPAGDILPDAAGTDEAPKMKKVCRMVDVVGSAIPRKICTMKPIKPARNGG